MTIRLDFMNHDINGITFDLEVIRQFFSGLIGSLPQFNILLEDVLSAPVLLLVAAIIIFLGVTGEAFFKRTGIPDIAFLMVLGVIVGPVFGIIPTDIVIDIVPYFAAIALIIIMFDGGLNLDIQNVVRTAHYAVLLSVLGFVVSVVVVAVLAWYGLGWSMI